MHPILSLLLTVSLSAQTPPPAKPPSAPPDLATLASSVQAAHHPNGPTARVTSLEAAIQLHLVDKRAEQRGLVELEVRFLEWQRASGKLAEPLIRYEVRGSETPIVRGRDREGPWQLAQGEPRDLDAADAAEERAAFERHANLVRQMLRFLSPGDVLLALQQPSAVRDDDLVLNARTKIACHTVTGRLPAFPLLQQGGEDAPVELTVWVDRASSRLVAVDAWPLEQGVRIEVRGERVLLRDLQERDGLLVPFTLAHLFREADGKLALKTEAKLTDIKLRKPLLVESFDRTKK
jgi:hypothetical protein